MRFAWIERPHPQAPARTAGKTFCSLRLAVVCCLLLIAGVARAESVRILVQSSPLAGAQYYEAGVLWQEMEVGDALTLTREPENAHDANAVRIDWRGRKLGYLPRAENRAVAAEMDRGARVEGRIAGLTAHRNPWRRVRIEVFVVL